MLKLNKLLFCLKEVEIPSAPPSYEVTMAADVGVANSESSGVPPAQPTVQIIQQITYVTPSFGYRTQVEQGSFARKVTKRQSFEFVSIIG